MHILLPCGRRGCPSVSSALDYFRSIPLAPGRSNLAPAPQSARPNPNQRLMPTLLPRTTLAITDDRGAAVSLAPPSRTEPILRSSIRWSVIILAAICIGMVIAFEVLLAIGMGVIYAGGLVIIAGICFLTARRFRHHRPGRATARALLARRRCPACTYDLTALPADPDGCTTCPECSAGWNVPGPP